VNIDLLGWHQDAGETSIGFVGRCEYHSRGVGDFAQWLS
jgi:hypothetical protein